MSWLDVFCERPFAGNPLAVFPDADALETTQMQAIARELGLSESVFVMGGAQALRIFTPSAELPLAWPRSAIRASRRPRGTPSPRT